jgi:sugar/nucleoside kinase (ribokinase family)
LYEISELFFCNKEEAQIILKTEEQGAVKLAEMMRALGPKIAIITDGPNGAYAANGNSTWHMPMYPDPAPPVDRTGAGDAFSSTVTSYIALGMSIDEALLRGPINSMSVVQYVGAQEGLLNSEKLEALLEKAPQEYRAEKIG